MELARNAKGLNLGGKKTVENSGDVNPKDTVEKLKCQLKCREDELKQSLDRCTVLEQSISDLTSQLQRPPPVPDPNPPI